MASCVWAPEWAPVLFALADGAPEEGRRHRASPRARPPPSRPGLRMRVALALDRFINPRRPHVILFKRRFANASVGNTLVQLSSRLEPCILRLVIAKGTSFRP